MLNSEIEEFAEIFVQKVRDHSIRSLDSQQMPISNSPIAKRWRQSNQNEQGRSSLQQVMIPDCVDDALFHLLNAIDSGELKLLFVSKSGKVVDLSNAGLGELAGWYMGSSEGWRAKFSKERFVDDFEDLT